MITMVFKGTLLVLFVLFNLIWIGKCLNTGTNQEQMSYRTKNEKNNRIGELDEAESHFAKKNQEKTGLK